MGSRQPAVEIKFDDKKMQKFLDQLADKYPKAAGMAIRDMTFAVKKEVKSKWLQVKDGTPSKGSAKDRWYPPRTTKEGLRYRTGQTSGAIRTAFQKVRGLVVRGSVGLNGPHYAVEHEREGRNYKKGKYAFLVPALKSTRALRKKILEKYMKAALKKGARL